ncbi:MAG: uncharacterized protein A8A55_1798 [Amphiamblys sp. WSBS2006]|nr:MAG: uncharacterized protein A8A55_1798 [Amphiamblys sp. WSBS2006]
MDRGIVVFISSVSGNRDIKRNQMHLHQFLTGKKMHFTELDIAADPDARSFTEGVLGGRKVLPPLIFVDGRYKGAYEDFDTACEDGTLDVFFA